MAISDNFAITPSHRVIPITSEFQHTVAEFHEWLTFYGLTPMECVAKIIERDNVWLEYLEELKQEDY